MSVKQARESAAEGYRDNYAFSVYLIVSDLVSVPAVDDLVSVAGVEYLIMGKDTDDVDDILRLDLTEKFARGI